MPVFLIYVHGQCNLSQLHFETGTHILGHCISCYKNKRGAEHCRLVQHAVNVNKMGTLSQNVDKNCIMTVKTHSTCTKFPQQGQNSHSASWSYKVSRWSASYFSRPGENSEPYVTGYMVPYSDHNWADWFQRFTLQTGCDYTFCLGKESNTQSRGTGVMKMKGKLFTYTSAWSHAYSCLHCGTGRFKLERKSLITWN